MASKEVRPRKKKPKKTILQPATFSSLPDEITENILARVSRWKYPWLSLVSKRFRSLLSSTELYKTRSQIGASETCLYVCLHPPNRRPCPSWFSLWPKRNPVKTRTKRRGKLRFKQNSSGKILVPIPNSSCQTPPLSTVAVGSEIYLIGGIYEELPSSSVRIFDCRSHTWRDGPNMTVARNDAHAVLLDEKIYVVGGIGKYSTNWFEVFDIKTQSWTALPIPDDELRDHTGDELACVVQGNIYVMAHTRVYTYEPRQGTWKSTARETRSYELVYVSCVIENALYSCCEEGYCHWYDFKGGEWKVIKGLEELREHRTRGLRGDRVLEVANHGGNLLVFWDAGTKLTKRKIWYAKISLETRCNGNEVCGKVEWADFLLTSYDFYHCASVSV